VGSGRFRRGWELTKRSWALLRGHRELMRFPILGMLATLVPVALLALPGLYLIDTEDYAPGIALLAVGLYLAALASIFFAVALAAATDALFRGEANPTAGGYATARARFGAVAGWAFVSALLGTILAVIESQRGLAQIVGQLIGAAWGLITFLAVPVIAIEGTGPIETIKRSAHLFRERWAGQITGNVAIGGIIGLLAILPSILVIALGVYLWLDDPNGTDVAAGGVLVAIGTVVLIVAVLVQRALRGVFGVALYRYAADGRATGGFSSEELDSAVGVRG
jgi:MFS family permease